MRLQHLIVILLFAVILQSSSVSTKGLPTHNASTPSKNRLRQSNSPWQDFAPEGEEFSVLMPQPPHVSRGIKYFYLNRDEPVRFSVYTVFHDKTLFVIQSYESTKAKELVKDLFWARKKRFKFERDVDLNGHKGKAFTQIGEGFSDKGQYFITRNHIYIVEAAKRDTFDPTMDHFLSSFKLGVVSASANTPATKPATSSSHSSATQTSVGNINLPIILSKQEPGFPQGARFQVTGTVTLRLTLSSAGHVDDIEVVSGLPRGLTEQAIEASKTIIFIPAEKDGKPVSQRVQVEYSFR
jgi:TonB family protein